MHARINVSTTKHQLTQQRVLQLRITAAGVVLFRICVWLRETGGQSYSIIKRRLVRHSAAAWNIVAVEEGHTRLGPRQVNIP